MNDRICQWWTDDACEDSRVVHVRTCLKPALYIGCDGYLCEEHKCRCAKPLDGNTGAPHEGEANAEARRQNMIESLRERGDRAEKQAGEERAKARRLAEQYARLAATVMGLLGYTDESILRAFEEPCPTKHPVERYKWLARLHELIDEDDCIAGDPSSPACIRGTRGCQTCHLAKRRR
jgi:hypothetical protein